MTDAYHTVYDAGLISKDHYDDLVKRLKDATEIINAYHAGLETFKKNNEELKKQNQELSELIYSYQATMEALKEVIRVYEKQNKERQNELLG